MNVAPKAGMWVTQNLISNQNAYFILHIKNIANNFVTIDFSISVYKHGSNVTPGKWISNFSDPAGVRQMPLYVFKKQMFQVLKRPSPAVRRAAIKTLFGSK